MDCHFTYTDKPDLTNLKQGDLLYRTPYIEELLEKVHKYYLKPIFKYFLILTQSCDLILRDGADSKTDYISLAAVLPFDHVLKKEILKYQADSVEQIGCLCDTSKRSSMYQFVEKILNNNHPEFFYLQEDNDNGLPESCCCFLRLSIAIRSREHYNECLKAKFIELREDFRAKLGWLVGNLYSRVGTDDWVPDYLEHYEFRRMINTILDKEAYWKDKESIKALKQMIAQKKIGEDHLTREFVQELADSIKSPKKVDRKERALSIIKDKLVNSGMMVEGANIDLLIKRLRGDKIFSANFQ